jgi:long-chain fatty acid transport protein
MTGLSGAGYDTGDDLQGVQSPLHNATIGMELEDDLNYSYNLGVMYKPSETITLGLAYRSECDADFEGDVLVNGVKVTTATMDYNHPQQIQAGVRYQPHNKFSIECDVVWTDWSINKEQLSVLDSGLTLQVIDGIATTVTEERFERDWEDTKQLRFGIEYILNEEVTLRGGYFYDPTPIPDTTLDMQWPDADKKTYSLGAGFNFGRYTIDTVLQYTDIEQARYLGGESENLNEAFAGNVVSASADGYILGAGVTLTARF